MKCVNCSAYTSRLPCVQCGHEEKISRKISEDSLVIPTERLKTELISDLKRPSDYVIEELDVDESNLKPTDVIKKRLEHETRRKIGYITTPSIHRPDDIKAKEGRVTSPKIIFKPVLKIRNKVQIKPRINLRDISREVEKTLIDQKISLEGIKDKTELQHSLEEVVSLLEKLME